MKKVILSLAAVATIACFASCSKTCNCRTYADGDEIKKYEVELDKDKFDKCSDMNTVVTILGKKNGIECSVL